jgi:hypothetical protein
VTPRPVRSPLECGRVRRRPRSQGSRCSTRMAASSARRAGNHLSESPPLPAGVIMQLWELADMVRVLEA